MVWAKAVTSFLGRAAVRRGALGTGVATVAARKRQARQNLGGEAQRRQAEEYAEMKGTRRARCIAAQLASGHQPDDLTREERGFFYGQ